MTSAEEMTDAQIVVSSRVTTLGGPLVDGKGAARHGVENAVAETRDA